MFQPTTLKVIDSHTGGEPTRTVVGWSEEVRGLNDGSLAERRDLLAKEYDWIRSSCIHEPRGHDAMVGALLCKPQDRECVAGVIFFNNKGYLHSCIHGTIGLAVTLLHMGRIQLGSHLIETPAGVVGVEVGDGGKVKVTNIPSYRYKKKVEVELPDYGKVIGDIAWGGNWFFLTDANDIDTCPAVKYHNIADLSQFGAEIIKALSRQNITGKDGAEIDHVEIFGHPTEGVSDSRSFVLCPGMEYDRSPCGTGTSAKLACLYEDGNLEQGQMWRQASILETVFECCVKIDSENQIIPILTGSAFVNGESTLIIQDEDPFRYGISEEALPKD